MGVDPSMLGVRNHFDSFAALSSPVNAQNDICWEGGDYQGSEEALGEGEEAGEESGGIAKLLERLESDPVPRRISWQYKP
jgi:hypothetical protein